MARDEGAYLRQQERQAKGAVRRYFQQIQQDTTECVRAHPWWTVLACVSAGLLGGILIGRQTHSKNPFPTKPDVPRDVQDRARESSAAHSLIADTLSGLRSALQQGLVGTIMSKVVAAWRRDDQD